MRMQIVFFLMIKTYKKMISNLLFITIYYITWREIESTRVIFTCLLLDRNNKHLRWPTCLEILNLSSMDTALNGEHESSTVKKNCITPNNVQSSIFSHSDPSIHSLLSSHLNTASYKIFHFRLMFVCLWIRKCYGPWNGTSECFNAWGFEHIYCCEINDAYRVVVIALLQYVSRIRNWFILFFLLKKNTREWCSVFLYPHSLDEKSFSAS